MGAVVSAAHAASATEMRRLAVFLNSRLVCVSELIIAIHLSYRRTNIRLFVLATPKERKGSSAVIAI